jgi:hypothetical protein
LLQNSNASGIVIPDAYLCLIHIRDAKLFRHDLKICNLKSKMVRIAPHREGGISNGGAVFFHPITPGDARGYQYSAPKALESQAGP